MEKVLPPPGFVSQPKFVLKRVARDKERSNSVSGLEETNGFGLAYADGFKTVLTNRPWIVHDHTAPIMEALKPIKSEVKAETEVLDKAPVFYPTEEEFKDTLSYIASLRDKAEPYGICCVVPPPSWKPPCLLKEKNVWEASSFIPQTQLIDGVLTASGDDTSPHNKVKLCRIERGSVRYTLESFKNFADSYKKQHFSVKDEVSSSKSSSRSLKPQEEPTVADIEKEYRQVVESPLVEIGVMYGNDQVTTELGSGFPEPGPSETCNYRTSGWNLNNTATLPGSLLPFEDCKSICVPRLSVGMCLSSQLWRSEKERLYMLGYLHLGAPRVWYSVAGCHRSKFKDTMNSLIPEMSEEQSKTMIVSPYVLSVEGIPVTRCVQSPGQYVVVFPGSHYSAVDCGFNCLEKASFAPLDWLPHAEIAVQQNQEMKRKSLISYDKLLLTASRDAVKCLKEYSLTKKYTWWCECCGKDKMFSNIVKSRVKQEKSKREYLGSMLKKWERMKESDDAVSKRECCVCFVDLHLSAVRCSCSADEYTCLSHMRSRCACPYDSKSFLYRYAIDELNLLVEALEGKLSSMFRWGNIERNFNASPAITGDKEKRTSEAVPGLRKDVADESMEQAKTRVKERSIEEILNARAGNDDETGPVRPSRPCSSTVNTAKKHKQR